MDPIMLSVVCSGIRPENWERMYKSIFESTDEKFEFIIVSPYPLPAELNRWAHENNQRSRIIHIEDWGSPARCCQIGLLAAQGEWVSFAFDDGYYLPKAIDGMFAMLRERHMDYKTAIAGKFYEVVHSEKDRGWVAKEQEKDDLYYIKTHEQARSPLFPDHFLIFGPGLISRKLLLEIGGFDCQFELMGMAFLEMSARIQLYGCNSLLTKMPVFTCQWSFGTPGHEVIVDAYDHHDKELFQMIYRDPINKPVLIMTLDNWMDSPKKWARRFPQIDISIIMPTIRTHLLQGMYESIKSCYHGSWELILVGPNPIPSALSSQPNVKWIQSYRSPIACRQQALLASRGDYICYAADDVTFIPGSLDEAYQTCKEHDFDYKFVVAGKYLENTDAQHPDNAVMREDIYYHLNHHQQLQPAMANFPDWLIVNTGLVSRKLLIEIGGWDCDFEVCSMACCDISMRLQNHGAKVYLQNNPIFHSTWYQNRDGDHGPIHDAHTDHDWPLYEKIWTAPEAKNRAVVDLNKWKMTPEKWNRRFQW